MVNNNLKILKKYKWRLKGKNFKCAYINKNKIKLSIFTKNKNIIFIKTKIYKQKNFFTYYYIVLKKTNLEKLKKIKKLNIFNYKGSFSLTTKIILKQ